MAPMSNKLKQACLGKFIWKFPKFPLCLIQQSLGSFVIHSSAAQLWRINLLQLNLNLDQCPVVTTTMILEKVAFLIPQLPLSHVMVLMES